MQVTPEEMRRVADYLRENARDIACDDLPHADSFAVNALDFEVRKCADMIERQAARMG